MKPLIAAGALSAYLLTGCHSPSVDNSVSSQRYGAASAVAVTRHTQYQLWDRGLYSATPGASSSVILHANSGRLSFDWDGDAIELLNDIARERGLRFSYSGVRLPLPVNLHVRDMTFANVLRLTEAQTRWRATLRQYPGLLHVSFMPPERAK